MAAQELIGAMTLFIGGKTVNRVQLRPYYTEKYFWLVTHYVTSPVYI